MNTTETTTTTSELQPGRDDCFGLCPKCVEAGEFEDKAPYFNVYKDHYKVCKEHRVYWHIGRGLFSSWEFESEDAWKAHSTMLESMTRVAPRYLPATERMAQEQEQQERRILFVIRMLNDEKRNCILNMLKLLSGWEIEPLNWSQHSSQPLPF